MKNIRLNNEISLNLPKLIEGRLLIQANSGGGKSWAIRRLVEQAYGNVQIIIIDPEGEFGTLREKYDFVLAGKGGDTPAEPKSASLLAKRLLELKVSAIVDLYELPVQSRKNFVKLFVDSMVNAPKELWHPVLIIIDEAHAFCPEKDEAESAGAIKDLASRGRKRKFCAVLATQRISKLAKDAAAECNNKLIGRSAIDIDMKRAADELGFTSREQFYSLRKLSPGEFFAFGPAISNEVIQIKIGGIKTSEMKTGSGFKVAPPTSGIRKILAKLADLSNEAEQEVKTIAGLKAENHELKRQLRNQIKETDPKAVEAAIRIEYKKFDQERAGWQKQIENLFRILEQIGQVVQKSLKEKSIPDISLPKVELTKVDTPKLSVRKDYPEDLVENGELTNPERRILNAIAWMESIGVDQPEKAAVAFLAGYKFGGGAFNNPMGKLRTRGLIQYYGDKASLTDTGRENAEVPETPLTTEEMHKKVLNVLANPERRVLVPLLEAYPESLNGEELAEQSGYAFGAGAFNNPKGRLRTLGLIEYSGGRIKARDILFLNF